MLPVGFAVLVTELLHGLDDCFELTNRMYFQHFKESTVKNLPSAMSLANSLAFQPACDGTGKRGQAWCQS